MITNIISFFVGFFLSSVLDTTLGNLAEWNTTGAAFIVATIELFNKIFYSLNKKYDIIYLLLLGNYLKIGLIYGLIVDAFKLGS